MAIGKKLQVRDKVKICSTADDALSTVGGVGIGGKLTVTGQSVFTGNTTHQGGIHVVDNEVLTLGGAASDSYLGIWHNVSGTTRTNIIRDNKLSNIYLQSDANIEIGNKDNSQQGLVYTATEGIKLFHGGGQRLETTSDGVKIGVVGETDGNLVCTGDITAFASSDERLKDNIVPIPNALDKVLSISGNTFKWNNGLSATVNPKAGQEDTGVIAQEIEKLGLPGVTTVRETGTHAVNYEKLVPLLIEAIKELSTKVDALSNK